MTDIYRFASLPKPKETDWELELPEEQQELDGPMELSEEDAAERDRKNEALRQANERAEFKRRTQVMQRSLPRPSVIDLDSLSQNASHEPDLIQKAIATEMILLIANDARKYPTPGAKVRGSSKPLEVLDDEAIDKARLEVMLEIPTDDMKRLQENFDQAWNEVHSSSKLPGLSGYEDDEVDEYQLVNEAFDVSTPSCILLYKLLLTKLQRARSLPLPIPHKRATRQNRN